MPLVAVDATRRVTINEDGSEWVEMREADIGTLLAALGDGTSFRELQTPTPAMLRKMLDVFVVKWSYPDPVTPENLDRLSLDVVAKLFAELGVMLNGPTGPKGSG